MERKILETEYMHFELINGIIIGTFKPFNITLYIAKEIVTARLEIINGVAYPSLVDCRKLISMDKEARDYFSSENGSQGIKAAAILIDSVFGAYLSNFFLKVSVVKSPFQNRLFTDKEAALKWLEQYK